MNRNKFTYGLKLLNVVAIFATMLLFGAGSGFAGTTQESLTARSFSFGPSIGTARYGGSLVIFGEGFGKGEIVSLALEAPTENLGKTSLLSTIEVYSDVRGGFETSFPIDSFTSVGDRLIIKATGLDSKLSTETNVSILLAASAQLTQCANGGVGDPVLPCSGSNWDTGNVNNAKAHWVEGQSVAYRMVLEGFTVGSSNTVTIGYDTTKAGKRALDYLTSFDRTETLAMGNNPCSGVAGCSLGTFTTIPIPVDPNVTSGFDQIPGNGDDISQIPGVFTLFGGTITAVSGYSLSGSYAGDSHRSITITFTADQANMALSWGGHIATRADWGANNSAIFISGSPYHMSQDNCSFGCGSQDRALSASAILPAASITIIKDAQPNSVIDFNFTSTGQAASAFILDDDSGATDGVPDNIYSTTQVFNNLALFGAGNSITVTETSAGFFNLTAINCTSVGGTNNNIVSIPGQNVEIVLEAGEAVTCTFVNQVVTAANTSVSGRVVNEFGQGVSRARLSIYNSSTGETQIAVTNAFGIYQFEGLVVGDFYIVTVNHRKYSFVPDTQSFVLNDAIENLDFTAFAP